MDPVDPYVLRPRPVLPGEPANAVATNSVTHDDVINMLNVVVRAHRNASPDLRSATLHAADGAITFANMLQLITLDEANALSAQLFSPVQNGGTK